MKRGKSKERLDKILVDLGFFENKSKASAAILAGNVMIGTEVVTKAGFHPEAGSSLKKLLRALM